METYKGSISVEDTGKVKQIQGGMFPVIIIFVLKFILHSHRLTKGRSNVCIFYHYKDTVFLNRVNTR